jgi:hypothetical protein
MDGGGGVEKIGRELRASLKREREGESIYAI